MSQIQSTIFRELSFSGFEKVKPEFSSSDARVNFVGEYGQFNVSQWIQSDVKTREASHLPISAPNLFARYQPM
jgi:hypothetical protein